MATKEQVAQRTLRELRVFERGQPINGEYIESVTDEYDEFYIELQRERLAYWPIDTPADEAVRYLAVLLADRLANEYGKSLQFQQALMLRADGKGNHMSAKARLRDLANNSSELSRTEAVNY